MTNAYFMHRIKHDSSKEGSAAWDKGIEVHATADAAKQSYHAYLGAYAYEHAANIDYVSCMITDVTSGMINMQEEWIKPKAVEPEPEPEPEE